VPTWPSSRLAYARAHGNPFFVAELGRLHGPGGARPGALPEAVRDTLRVRLRSLTPAGQDVLSAAAVLGAAVAPAAVAAVTGREVAAVLAVLDEAAAAGLVAGGDGWSFGHDLIRDTARLELPTADRLAVHARMAGYLRRQPDAAPAEVAHHLLESLPAGDAALAAEWAERAADAAMAQLAWEDAATFYTRALGAAPGAGPADRCRLLRGLGLAQLRGFDLTAGSSTLREAAGAARAAGDPALIGEVAPADAAVRVPEG
jgi:predicted ATPase